MKKNAPFSLHGIMATLRGIPCFEVHVFIGFIKIPSSSTLVYMIMASPRGSLFYVLRPPPTPCSQITNKEMLMLQEAIYVKGDDI